MQIEHGPAALIEGLMASERILLTGPHQPDGDSFGACFALQRILHRLGKEVAVAGSASYRYDWMPGASQLIGDSEVAAGAWDAVVVLDGDRHRLTEAATEAFQAAKVKGIVDHHRSTRPDGYTHFGLDADAGSTCEMLYGELSDWRVPLDVDLSTVLYTGLIFDTGAFRYTNTTPATHEMAAALIRTGIDHASICLRVLMDRNLSGLRLAADVLARARCELDARVLLGAVRLSDRERFEVVDGDIEGIVESLVQVHGVEVGVLFIEHPGGIVKLSLRSRGRIDVAAVAHSLSPSGGGHAKAAGVRLPLTLEEAQQRTLVALGRAL